MEEITSKTILQMKFWIKQVATGKKEPIFFYEISNFKFEISTKMKQIITKHITTLRI
jgi:hypothetical protein